MRSGKLNFTTRFVLLFGILLLAANFMLGNIILRQSKSSMKALINKNMLDVVNSAAGFMDGDALASLTKEDVGGELHTEAINKLSVFQNTIDIEFIYAVRPMPDGTYVFIVDPDPVNPADFGEEIILTEGLQSAGKGVAAVDSAPAEDEWGNFYSAFSPVFDSNGNVAAIIGIDFSSDWFDEQVRHYSRTITYFTAISVAIGCIIVVVMTNGVRRQIKAVGQGISDLSDNVDALLSEMQNYTDTPVPEIETAETGELDRLEDKIQSMVKGMDTYMGFLRKQAYTDSLTHVGNSSAYHELIHKINNKIESREHLSFALAIFDLNGLKGINDHYGHERGDEIIEACAKTLLAVFGAERTFRIGGDEFAVVAENSSKKELSMRLDELDRVIAAYNESNVKDDVRLSVACGISEYIPGVDMSYRDVFVRTDEIMYENKKRHYDGSSKA